MELLKSHHENIRILASRELDKFGVKRKLKKLPRKTKRDTKKGAYKIPLECLETVEVLIGNDIVPVPKVFYDLISFIRMDMLRKGLFSQKGSKVKGRILVRFMDSGYEIPDDTDVIEVCVVTKIFLRNIPGRLIPQDFTPWFIDASRLAECSEEAVSLCVLLLPLENIFLLTYLMEFLQEVTTMSAQNDMTPRNLAAVIAPNLFTPMTMDSKYLSSIAYITQILIGRAATLIIVPEVLLNNFEELEEEQRTRFNCCVWFSKKQLTFCDAVSRTWHAFGDSGGGAPSVATSISNLSISSAAFSIDSADTAESVGCAGAWIRGIFCGRRNNGTTVERD